MSDKLVRDLWEPHFIKNDDFERTPDAVVSSHATMRMEREKAAREISRLKGDNRRLRQALEIARSWVPFSHADTVKINELVYGEEKS